MDMRGRNLWGLSSPLNALCRVSNTLRWTKTHFINCILRLCGPEGTLKRGKVKLPEAPFLPQAQASSVTAEHRDLPGSSGSGGGTSGFGRGGRFPFTLLGYLG